MTNDGSSVTAGLTAESSDQRQLFLILLAGAAALLYVIGFASAAVLTLGSDGPGASMNKALSYAVTTIGAILATNFGALLGLSKVRRALYSLREAMALAGTAPATVLQIVAAWLYFVCLIAALVVWTINGFHDWAQQPIKDMTMSLIAVAAAALAVVIGKS